MTKQKTTLKTHIKEWLTPSLILGGIIGGAVYFGELKGLIFESEEQRIKTKNHINTDINPVTVFRQADTLSKRTDTVAKRQDTLIIMQKKLDTLYEIQNQLLDSIMEDNRKKRVFDSVTNVERQKSRNAREYKMDLILEKLNKLNDTL